MAELKAYQVTAARTLATALAHYGASLDASDTGIGKTYTAAGLAAGSKRPVGVVCPKPIVPDWQEVLAGFGVQPIFVLNYEKLARGNTEFGTWRKRKFAWSPGLPGNLLLLWDEVHRCKSYQTKNAKMLLGAKPFLNHMMSATAAQSALDMRAIGEMLQLFRKDEYYWWARNHGCVAGGFSVLELSGESGVVEEANKNIHKAVFSLGFPAPHPPRGVRIRKEDVPGFPLSTVITQPWDFGDQGAIAAWYAQMQEEMARHEGVVNLDDFGNHLTDMLRQRQEVELLKVPLLVEKAHDHLEEGKSVVIFVNFRETIAALGRRFSTTEHCVIQGVRSVRETAERKAGIADFQAGKVRLCLANSAAGGVGISLHDLTGRHPRVTLISPTFDAVVLKQVLGRTPRNGGGNVLQYLAVAAGTIEMAVLKSALKKITQIDLLNDGAGLIYPTLTAVTPIPSPTTFDPAPVTGISVTGVDVQTPPAVPSVETEPPSEEPLIRCPVPARGNHGAPTSSPLPLHNPAPTDGSGVTGVAGAGTFLETGADDEQQVAEATLSAGGSLSSAQGAEGFDFQARVSSTVERGCLIQNAGSSLAPAFIYADPPQDRREQSEAPGAESGGSGGVQGGEKMSVLPGGPSGMSGFSPSRPRAESPGGDATGQQDGFTGPAVSGGGEVRTDVLELPPEVPLVAVAGVFGKENFVESAAVVGSQCSGSGEHLARRPFSDEEGGRLTSESETPSDVSWSGPSREITVHLPGTPTTTALSAGPQKHAKHGPSGLKLKERCPQFENTKGGNVLAERGTAMHDALETGRDGALADTGEEEYVAACRRIIRAKLAKHGRGRKVVAEHKEILLNMDFGGGITTFGTCDRLDIFEGWDDAVMMDFKFGFWPIDDPADNPQALAYAFGAFQRYPRLGRIEFYFLVPRRDEILHATFYREQMPAMAARLRAIIVAADDPASPERPGDALCQFCAKASSCGAFVRYAADIATRYDTALAVSEVVHGSLISDPAVISQLLQMAPALEKAIEGWRKKARDIVAAGGTVPGFRLQNRAGARGITSAQAVWEAVKDRLSPEQFAACADLSLPDILKAYGDTYPRGQKGRMATALEDRLTDLGVIEKKDPTPTVVRNHREPKAPKPQTKQLN